MPDLPESGSPKAARILAAAGELLLGRGSRGVTIADVAQRAHVGKGTVYLYWKSKEDLLIGLVCRDFIALADAVTAEVTADPDLARPSRLCPNMLRHAKEHPFVDALQRGDDHLLGVLTDDPRAAELLDHLGLDGVMHRILPLWRANGLARTDWPVAEQAFALQALTAGFITTRIPATVTDPAKVLAAAVTALLGPENATDAQVRTAAEQGLGMLADGRAKALKIVAT